MSKRSRKRKRKTVQSEIEAEPISDFRPPAAKRRRVDWSALVKKWGCSSLLRFFREQNINKDVVTNLFKTCLYTKIGFVVDRTSHKYTIPWWKVTLQSKEVQLVRDYYNNMLGEDVSIGEIRRFYRAISCFEIDQVADITINMSLKRAQSNATACLTRTQYDAQEQLKFMGVLSTKKNKLKKEITKFIAASESLLRMYDSWRGDGWFVVRDIVGALQKRSVFGDPTVSNESFLRLLHTKTKRVSGKMSTPQYRMCVAIHFITGVWLQVITKGRFAQSKLNRHNVMNSYWKDETRSQRIKSFHTQRLVESLLIQLRMKRVIGFKVPLPSIMENIVRKNKKRRKRTSMVLIRADDDDDEEDDEEEEEEEEEEETVEMTVRSAYMVKIFDRWSFSKFRYVTGPINFCAVIAEFKDWVLSQVKLQQGREMSFDIGSGSYNRKFLTPRMYFLRKPYVKSRSVVYLIDRELKQENMNEEELNAARIPEHVRFVYA